MENDHFQWVNPLFRLGHFLCRKLLVYQRVKCTKATRKSTTHYSPKNFTGSHIPEQKPKR